MPSSFLVFGASYYSWYYCSSGSICFRNPYSFASFESLHYDDIFNESASSSGCYLLTAWSTAVQGSSAPTASEMSWFYFLVKLLFFPFFLLLGLSGTAGGETLLCAFLVVQPTKSSAPSLSITSSVFLEMLLRISINSATPIYISAMASFADLAVYYYSSDNWPISAGCWSSREASTGAFSFSPFGSAGLSTCVSSIGSVPLLFT